MNQKSQFLDLKVPLGGLLTFYGIVLALYGFFSNQEIYKKSLGLNVNLVWGCVLLVIGLFLLITSIISRKQQQ